MRVTVLFVSRTAAFSHVRRPDVSSIAAYIAAPALFLRGLLRSASFPLQRISCAAWRVVVPSLMPG
ncbi:hypothetical protein CUJ87_06255 [Paraburkholderia caledonica]|jgi:hypothetical protein|nr:hypothetical protein CUJ87_06255 [Paraburkholderia caledonica]